MEFTHPFYEAMCYGTEREVRELLTDPVLMDAHPPFMQTDVITTIVVASNRALRTLLVNIPYAEILAEAAKR